MARRLNRKLLQALLHCLLLKLSLISYLSFDSHYSENHDEVTIFFSDIVRFTDISRALSPVKVCNMLDRLYLAFDALANKHEVFKVETIGDAWMGVTNCKSTRLAVSWLGIHFLTQISLVVFELQWKETSQILTPSALLSSPWMPSKRQKR